MTRAIHRIDIAELRRQLADRRGWRFWRSLEELADTPDFQEFLRPEFPPEFPHNFPRPASIWDWTASRRDFMRVMAASLALAGLSACSK